MKADSFFRVTTWVSLGGYALFSPASIAISQIFLGLALAAFAAFMLTKSGIEKIILPPWPIIAVIVLFIVYRLVSMIVAQTDVFMIREEWLFVMVIIGAVMFRDMKNLTRSLDVFALGLLIMSGYGLWQHFVGVDLYHQVLLDRMVYGFRVIGNFSTYLTFSGFFAVASMFMIPIAFGANQRWRKSYYLLASQTGLACVLFNYSRSSVVALIVGVVVLLLLISARYRRWVSLVILMTLAVGIVISPDFMSRFKQMGGEFGAGYANSRLGIWRAALTMIEREPAFGVGPGNFHDQYQVLRPNQSGRDLSHAHNDFLNVAAESGLPAAIIFGLLWFLVFYYLYRGYRRCPDGFQKGLLLGSVTASVVFLVMSQFEASFADEEVRLLLMFVWAIGLAVLGNLKLSERLSEIA